MNNKTNDTYTNVDPFLVEQLKRDPRVLRSELSLPEQFRTFMEWRISNPHLLETQEWLLSILSTGTEMTLRDVIRVLSRFSGASQEIQKKVVTNILGENNKFIEPKISFRLSESKSGKQVLEIDVNKTTISLKNCASDHQIQNTCYG